MTLESIIKENRSRRRFDQSVAIPKETIVSWIDAARYTASAANAQPLRYKVVTEAALAAKVFECLVWAAALPDWPGPAEGQRPSAYVIICSDTSVGKGDVMIAYDEGIAAQSIMLQATEAGFGGCILASIKKKDLFELLGLQGDTLRVDMVLALGKPVEEVVIEEVAQSNGAMNYWRDESQVHHVPKRTLDMLML